MNVNDDFSKRVLLHADEIQWEDTPMQGVRRRRLDRVVTDHDRVTTIVEYSPGSHFSEHMHPAGEEFIVLEGVFEDDYGDWPTGSYIRNPPLSKHVPGSKKGCLILVKLCQFQPHDRTFVHIDLNKTGQVRDRDRSGVSVTPLFSDGNEAVRIEYWQPGVSVNVDNDGGSEIFVLDGGCMENKDVLRKYSWLRTPTGAAIEATAGSEGARVWIKSGHLPSTR